VKIGVLGGGQLGRMMALAAHPLAMRCVFLDPAADAPAGAVGEHIRGSYEDPAKLAEISARCQVATYEFESVPVESARALAAKVPVYPPPRALEVSQDRLPEKQFFERLGVPTAAFAPVSSEDDLTRALERLGFPAVLKTRRFGYDGKGQALLRNMQDARDAWSSLGEQPLIVEKFVTFRRELSVIGVRGRDGETRFWPVVENHHAGGILRLSLAPAPGLDAAAQKNAEDIAGRVLRELEYVGVAAIELFDTDAGLLANEMAPRVHNSGHWTIEGAETSQFENHVRAITGLPLGATASLGPCAMVNLIGKMPDAAAVLATEGAHFHSYEKEPAPGRKLGHVTIRARTQEELAAKLARVRALVGE
jgi:5-(carboxyamino)imidazole ribonucleotide synthase